MDNRYQDSGPIDSTISSDGDEQIIGMDARINPERLKPGYAQFLQNTRLDTLAVSTRYGQQKMTNSIAPSGYSPLFIPFTVGASAVIAGPGNVTDGIYASCVFLDPNNNNAAYIFMATGSKVYTYAASNNSVTTITYPANETVEATDNAVDIFQVGGSVYLLRGDLGTSIAVTSIVSGAASSATVTTVASHGLSTNMYVRIGGAAQAPYNGDYQITSTGLNTFTYVMASNPAASPATGTVTLNRLKTPLVWNGTFGSNFTLNPYGVYTQNFYYMPVSKWGSLQYNRAILEYARNQIIISSVNNANQYDVLNGIFTFGAGTNDYLVGVCPYQQTQTLVFCRNSVWLVNYVNGDVAAMTVQNVSNQLGCVSRRSIAVCGSKVLFLNERGVYVLEPGYELALRGNVMPLSAPLDGNINTINFNAIQVAWGTYYLNRYYLAVPTNGSTRNNRIFVYNFINEAWESIDTLPTGFYCDEMQVMLNAAGQQTLYFISYEGGVYAAEQQEWDDFGAAGAAPGQQVIPSQFRTRRFTLGTNTIKKFTRVITVAEMDGSSTLTATAYTVNPTDSKTLATITNTAATSAQITRPSMINKRAYGVEILYQNTTGRMQILNYQVGAFVKDQKGTQTN